MACVYCWHLDVKANCFWAVLQPGFKRLHLLSLVPEAVLIYSSKDIAPEGLAESITWLSLQQIFVTCLNPSDFFRGLMNKLSKDRVATSWLHPLGLWWEHRYLPFLLTWTLASELLPGGSGSSFRSFSLALLTKTALIPLHTEGTWGPCQLEINSSPFMPCMAKELTMSSCEMNWVRVPLILQPSADPVLNARPWRYFGSLGSDPWSWRIPGAGEQLGLWVTTTEPVLWGPGAAATETHTP